MNPPFGANHFLLTGEDTTIVYFPNKGGPISADPEQNGGLLEYRGPEGSQSFVGQDISLLNSPLGNMVTVMLSKHGHSQHTDFLMLLLPTITLLAGDFVRFETFLLRAQATGLAEGPAMAYHLLPLHGTANNVILPD